MNISKPTFSAPRFSAYVISRQPSGETEAANTIWQHASNMQGASESGFTTVSGDKNVYFYASSHSVADILKIALFNMLAGWATYVDKSPEIPKEAQIREILKKGKVQSEISLVDENGWKEDTIIFQLAEELKPALSDMEKESR